MIKATELRIGNLISWNPKLTNPKTTLLPEQVEVSSISEDKIGYISPKVEHRVEPFEDDLLQLETPHSALEEFEPISLTPELLEKCGFERDGSGFNNWRIKKEQPFDERWQLENVFSFVFKDGEITSDQLTTAGFKSGIKFLHQLQNFYFVLTGEELKIDLV